MEKENKEKYLVEVGSDLFAGLLYKRFIKPVREKVLKKDYTYEEESFMYDTFVNLIKRNFPKQLEYQDTHTLPEFNPKEEKIKETIIESTQLNYKPEIIWPSYNGNN